MDHTPDASSPSDLPAKYQKLATEYSKLRAQVTVLKKGVLDEQSTSGKLRDDLKEKDQKLRKQETEVECLNFRNQQLTKRVSVLQDELDQRDASSKSKSKSKNQERVGGALAAFDAASLSVLNTELQSKIEENERLHGRLQVLSNEYDGVIDELRRELNDLKCSTSAKLKEQAETLEQQRDQLNKLHQEKVRVDSKLSSTQEELDKSKQLALKL